MEHASVAPNTGGKPAKMAVLRGLREVCLVLERSGERHRAKGLQHGFEEKPVLALTSGCNTSEFKIGILPKSRIGRGSSQLSSASIGQFDEFRPKARSAIATEMVP